jgi:3,4-dihydroxy 2-butanone 4-phosphate synthase/GTP cyclohydrolase II
VIAHPGYPEAAIELARIAGLLPAVVEAFPMERSGEYRTVPRIVSWARRKNIEVVSIPQIVEYQWQHQRLLEKAASVRLPTRHTALTAAAYVDPRNGSILLTLVSSDVRGREDVLLHMRRSCFPGDTLHSTACDCRLMLDEALARLDSEPGVLIYLTSDRSTESLLSCPLEEGGSLGADDALLAAQIVADLGVSSVRLLGEEAERPEIANALSVSAFETLRPAV